MKAGLNALPHIREWNNGRSVFSEKEATAISSKENDNSRNHISEKEKLSGWIALRGASLEALIGKGIIACWA